MALVLVTPPATEPMMLAEAKAHLRMDIGIPTATLTLATVLVGHKVTINGLTFTAAAVADLPNRVFDQSGDDTADAASLVLAINHATAGVPGVYATSALGVVTLVAEEVALIIIGASGTITAVSNDDALLAGLIIGLIKAAREWCEGYQNRAYITQTWHLYLDQWPEEYIRVPLPPLQSVPAAGIKYTDSAGAINTWLAANYLVDVYSEPGRIVLAYGKSWPSVMLQPAYGIEVEFIAGYGVAAAVPERVKQAMKLLVGHWYENREAVLIGTISKEIEFAVKALLSLERIWPV